ncbi:hypothetical protein AKG94_04320 [Vibrio harveyi]|uniref:Uncharacterized protein n=1 Tax=Vibrio harveyi TaxID=669 RepID=A0A8B3DKF1_VIBHA|nr:hypothetical protein CU052_03850 [Vibrio harveyi]KNY47854.1 hypothetical protein AKG94_04320 [Vibrio harveyi]RCR65041.1 hypothetical protein DTW68_01305 [Vibrio harveyi]RIW18044.1 hypothetical protein DS957_003080 [Vibrio harveyi]
MLCLLLIVINIGTNSDNQNVAAAHKLLEMSCLRKVQQGSIQIDKKCECIDPIRQDKRIKTLSL